MKTAVNLLLLVGQNSMKSNPSTYQLEQMTSDEILIFMSILFATCESLFSGARLNNVASTSSCMLLIEKYGRS
jgi:hypothetical protein